MHNNRVPNTSGLKEHARKKKENTLVKVDNAIRQLLKSDEKINFNSVSMKSGVSKAYLYKQEDVRKRIESLREQQTGILPKKQQKKDMTNASKDVLIAAKNKKIKALMDENAKLKEELETLRGKLYDIL